MTTQNRKLAATARALAINGKKPAFASSAWRVPAIKLRTISNGISIFKKSSSQPTPMTQRGSSDQLNIFILTTSIPGIKGMRSAATRTTRLTYIITVINPCPL